MARPTKLTPELSQAIVAGVALGLPLSAAAERAGITGACARMWLARGEGRHERPATPLFVAFVAAIQKAKADDVARRVARIEQAARGGAVLKRRTITKPDGSQIVEEQISA